MPKEGPPFKMMLGICALAVAVLAYQWEQNLEKTNIPESASATSLDGPGYKVTPSQLGEGILEITGSNLFPFQPPLKGIELGRERIERACGPIIVFDAGFDAVPQTKAHAKVADASKCF